jgi:hypothetical protein
VFYSIVGIVILLAIILMAVQMRSLKIEKKFKVIVWSEILVFSEILIMFGVAAITQAYFTPGWIMDYTAIVGLLLSVVWTAVSVIIVSRELQTKSPTKRKRYADILIPVIGFVMLFTPFLGFGVALIIMSILNSTLLVPMYKEKLQVSAH